MSRILVCAALALNATNAFAAKPAPPPEPLAPSGKWSIEYGTNMCVLSRPFGSGDRTILFAFKPAPNSDQARIMLIEKAGGRALSGSADVRLSDGSRPSYAQARTGTAKGMVLTAIDLPRSSLAPLEAKDGSIVIRFGPKLNYRFSPGGMEAAFKALAACERDLLKSWGMDEAAQDSLASLPKVQSTGLRSDDYPDKLVERGVQGSVGALLTIDPTGKVAACRAVETSGTPELDAVTCSGFMNRAKYQPALDRDGKPMQALAFMRVNWLIEDDWGFGGLGLSTAPSSPVGSVAQ